VTVTRRCPISAYDEKSDDCSTTRLTGALTTALIAVTLENSKYIESLKTRGQAVDAVTDVIARKSLLSVGDEVFDVGSGIVSIDRSQTVRTNDEESVGHLG
jgi:hypothetical protein